MAKKDNNYTEKDRKAHSIIDLCFDHSKLFFEDRERNLERFEGIRKKREHRQRKYDHEYISTAASEMIEQKAAFSTQAVTNFGNRMYTVATHNNVAAARDAQAATTLINFFMSNIPLSKVAYELHKDMFLCGTAILEVQHETKTTKQPDPNQSGTIKITVDENGKFGSISAPKFIDQVEYSQPVIKQVKLNNFWPDPDATCIDDCRFVCVRQLITWNQIKRDKIKYNLTNLERAKKMPIPKKRHVEALTRDGQHQGLRNRSTEYDVETITQRNQRNEATKKNPIMELVKIYTPGRVQFVLNGIVISEPIVIYPGINYPFRVFKNQSFQNEFFGRADLELVINNIEFYEEMTNLIHDKMLMNLKPVLFIDAMNMDQDQMQKYKNASAGDVIALTSFDSAGVREFQPAAPDPSTIAFAQGFLGEAKRALAINPLMEGEQPGSAIRTEGSLELFQRLGSTRMQTQINILVHEWEKIGSMMLQMSKIFADKEVDVAVTGALGDTMEQAIDPRQLNSSVKFKVKLGAIADPRRQQKIDQMLRYIEAAKNLDQLGIFRGEQALAETAQYADFFEDPVSLYETDGEVLAARNEMQALAAGKQAAPSQLSLPSAVEFQQQQVAQQPPQQPQQQQVEQQQVPQQQ